MFRPQLAHFVAEHAARGSRAPGERPAGRHAPRGFRDGGDDAPDRRGGGDGRRGCVYSHRDWAGS